MLRVGAILQQRYQIESKIGHNTAHQVWLARDITIPSNQLVVVKILLAGEVTQWDEFRLFEREAKILKQLNHPQIPKYLDYFPLNEPIKAFVLVQEYIRGESFKDVILREKRFTESEIRQIAINILRILIYLHELNPPVLHRDIKPSNLIWGADGYIYLIDFGAVQYRAAVEGSTFTVVGTYGYTPIEQFGGRTVPGSDIYALGATLIHLLTGVAPCNLPQADFKIQFADRVNLNPDFIQWLRKAIEPDVKKRFDNAKAALKALRSGIVNHSQKKPINLSQESYDSRDIELKNIFSQNTSVELEKSLDKLTIKYRESEIDIIIIIFAIFWLSISAFMFLFLMILLSLFFIILLMFVLVFNYYTYSHLTLCLYDNIFEIYRYKDFIGYKYILDKGFIKDIEDVIPCNVYDENKLRKHFILIQTKYNEYVFGEGLSKQECIWLTAEIKYWLEQKQ